MGLDKPYFQCSNYAKKHNRTNMPILYDFKNKRFKQQNYALIGNYSRITQKCLKWSKKCNKKATTLLHSMVANSLCLF